MIIEWQVIDTQDSVFLPPVFYTLVSDEELSQLPNDEEREGHIRSVMNDQLGHRLQWRIKHRHSS